MLTFYRVNCTSLEKDSIIEEYCTIHKYVCAGFED
jgi:hypothetical protein